MSVGTDEVSPAFVRRFDAAAALAREGRPREALEALSRLFDPFDDPSEPRAATGEFLAVVRMRRAWCLMDLGRHAEARRVLCSRRMGELARHLDDRGLYDLHFSRANSLGALGRVEEMDWELARALELASGRLGDLELCERAWYKLLCWAREHGRWAFLNDRCAAAHRFGAEHGSAWLQHQAAEFGCHALRGLGRMEEAERGARVVLARLREAGADEGRLAEWASFLASVGGQGH